MIVFSCKKKIRLAGKGENMKDLILETKNLSKRYELQVADENISLEIKKNTIYGLLCPNGAGKSSILKMSVGLLRPTGGQILFGGQPWSPKHLFNIMRLWSWRHSQ